MVVNIFLTSTTVVINHTDQPIWLFCGWCRYRYIGHSWTDSQCR